MTDYINSEKAWIQYLELTDGFPDRYGRAYVKRELEELGIRVTESLEQENVEQEKTRLKSIQRDITDFIDDEYSTFIDKLFLRRIIKPDTSNKS